MQVCKLRQVTRMGYYKLSNEEFEALLKKTVCKEIDSLPAPPPSQEGFEKILRQLETHRGHQRLKSMGKNFLAASLALAVLIGSASFLFPQKVSAIGNKILQMFYNETDGRKSVQYLLQEPQENNNSPGEVDPALKEAIARAPYHVKIPDYLPPGFNLQEVNAGEFATGIISITITYSSPSGQLIINQVNTLGEMAAGETNNSEAQLKEVQIAEQQGILTLERNGFVSLSFLDEYDIFFTISGKLAEEEILKIARSLK